MAVSNETIIRKMIKELQLALEKPNDQQLLVKHMSNIQVLSELILEQDEKVKKENPYLLEKERQMMFGDTIKTKEKEELNPIQMNSSLLDEDDANGESIFDF